ncbi:MAG: Na/Pi cotransporter family protein [Clostridia bacterium]|nr:Na/Pi cotransporter family protein [Clostridia bacterium]
MSPILLCMLSLLAGIGVFITGMNLMGDGLEKSAGERMKRIFKKVSNNPFINVGAGAVVTGIIQSSAATTVMAIGFVNAGVMSLLQATYIIMGANIGTTVTGVIVSLSALPISEFVSAFAFIGVMLMFIKKEGIKRLGQILCGFGLIFVGLSIMSGAFKDPVVTDAFANVFLSIKIPILLVVVGAAFTALIQSSSTTTGLLIILVGTGAMDLGTALYIVLGANIGTCITAFIASSGTNENARRTAIIHLLFNLIGGMLFFIVLSFLEAQVCSLLKTLIADPGMQLAWFHVVFNITTTLVLLPFAKLLTKIACKIIKEKKKDEKAFTNKHINDLFIKTPPIAVQQAKKEVEYMAELAHTNLKLSFNALTKKSLAEADQIIANEDILDFTNTSLTHYLIKLGPVVSGNDEKVVGSFFHVVNDLERIGDHAENFLDINKKMNEENLEFSEKAKQDLMMMYSKIEKMFEIAMNVFDKTDKDHLYQIAELEDEVDGLKDQLSAGHVSRMAKGDCSVELGAYFYSLVSGLERVADHLVNVAYSIVNPIGKEETLENK